MATQYTFVVADLRTGIPMASLPLNGVTIDEELNEPGSASAVLPLFGIPRQLIPQLRAVTAPARTALYIIADQTRVLWGGIIWKRRLRDHLLGIEASGFLSYYAKSHVIGDLTFTKTDQFTIARALIQHAHDKPGGNILLDLGTDLSGVVRDRAYKAADRKSIWETLQELTQLEDAFDIAVRYQLAADGTVSKYLNMGHPRLGRAQGNPDLMIEYPGNASDFEWPEEGDRMATAVFVRGDVDKTTGTPPVGSSVEQLLIDVGYPMLEEDLTASSNSSLTAQQQADAFLAALNHPITLPTFTLPSSPPAESPVPADYDVGDWFRVRITDPEWFPPGLNGEPGMDCPMRLVRRSITLSAEQGGESVSLTFNPYPAAQAIIA